MKCDALIDFVSHYQEGKFKKENVMKAIKIRSTIACDTRDISKLLCLSFNRNDESLLVEDLLQANKMVHSIVATVPKNLNSTNQNNNKNPTMSNKSNINININKNCTDDIEIKRDIDSSDDTKTTTKTKININKKKNAGDEIIGYLGASEVNIMCDNENDPSGLPLLTGLGVAPVGVHPSYQQMGIGKMLINWLVNQCENDIKELELEIDEILNETKNKSGQSNYNYNYNNNKKGFSDRNAYIKNEEKILFNETSVLKKHYKNMDDSVKLLMNESKSKQQLLESCYSYIVVLGDPKYYSKFEFENARIHSLKCKWDKDIPIGAFMVRIMNESVFNSLRDKIEDENDILFHENTHSLKTDDNDGGDDDDDDGIIICFDSDDDVNTTSNLHKSGDAMPLLTVHYQKEFDRF